MARKKQDKWESVKKKDSQPAKEDTQRYINKHMTAKMFVDAFTAKGYKTSLKDNLPIVMGSVKDANKIIEEARDVGYMGSLGINEVDNE